MKHVGKPAWRGGGSWAAVKRKFVTRRFAEANGLPSALPTKIDGLLMSAAKPESQRPLLGSVVRRLAKLTGSLAAALPPGLRRQARRGARLIYWILTPQRTTQRIAYYRVRKTSTPDRLRTQNRTRSRNRCAQPGRGGADRSNTTRRSPLGRLQPWSKDFPMPATDGKPIASGSPHTGRFFGYVDGVGETIFGWCFRRGGASLPRLLIQIGGQTVACVLPNTIRSDINELFGSDCATGFSFDLSSIHPAVAERLRTARNAAFQANVSFLEGGYILESAAASVLPREMLSRGRVSPREPSRNFHFSWEVIGDRIIHGWVFHKFDHSSTISIDIYYKAIHVDKIIVDEPHPDIAEEFACQLNGGFSYDLRRLNFLGEGAPLEANELEARISGADDDRLPNLPALVRTAGISSREEIRDAQKSVSFFTKPADWSSRLAIYAIHNRQKWLTANQRGMIRLLKDQGYSVVVSNSYPGNAKSLAPKIEENADAFVVRGNYGRDFASWVGFVLREYDLIRSREHTIFVNDSILGPCHDMELFFRRLAVGTAPILSLTDSYQQRYHLQTSFFVVRDTAWESREFESFFRSYRFPNERDEVVVQGEIGLTRTVMAAGLATEALAPYGKVAEQWLMHYSEAASEWLLQLSETRFAFWETERDRSAIRHGSADQAIRWYSDLAADIRGCVARNPQHSFWNILVSHFQYPFLKRELVTYNPEVVPNLHLIWDVVPATFHQSVEQLIEEALQEHWGRAPPVRSPSSKL